MMRRVLALVLLVAGGCDDGSAAHHDAAADSPTPVDAPLIDAPPPPAGHYYYVIDKVTVPVTNMQVRELALDLNGDMTGDNQLGYVLATLATMGLDTQLWFDKQIDTGKDIMLADLYTLDFVNAQSSTFTIYQGSNPMPSACSGPQDAACRHHLTGSASFTALGSPVDPPLTGDFVDGTLAAGPGHLTLQLAFPDAPPTQVTLIGARVKLVSPSATAVTSAILAGAITQSDVDTKVVPAMRAGAMAAVARDCTMLSNPPLCGCASNTPGQSDIGLLDTNHDCAISVDEVRNNSLLTALLSSDVTLDGQMCISVGLGAHAVPAGFVAPQ